MKKQLLKAVCLLLSVSLLCSCGAPENEATLSSVPETAGQTESSVDEATSSQETSIADSESKSEITKKPETEENSVAETTTEKTETTITTTKATETESTPKPETTIPTTTAKKPETSATPKPETTTATTTKKPETTATPKPETTTSTTTTKASETTTIVTEKPDVAPTGHCEGFDKLWGKTLVELGKPLEDKGIFYNYGWEFGEKGGKYIQFYGDFFELFDIDISFECCYNHPTQAATLLYEVQSSLELNNVYGFNLWGGGPYSIGHFKYCEEFNDKGKKCPDYNVFFNKIKELYGEPDKSRLEGEMKVYLWSNTLDGDILLTNCMNINSETCYDVVNLYVLESNHKFTKEQIDYQFSLEI